MSTLSVFGKTLIDTVSDSDAEDRPGVWKLLNTNMNKLHTINAEELQNRTYEPTHFLVDELIPEGLHILAGAPKIGKSWLASVSYTHLQIEAVKKELSRLAERKGRNNR